MPGKLLVFPYWKDNPFLNLLYLAPRAAGYDVRGVTVLDSLLSVLRDANSKDVIHLHWTSPICQTADGDAEAGHRLTQFVDAMDSALERGAKLVWTVHNVLPHDAKHIDAEVQLHRYLAEKSAAIHIMSPSTKSETAAHYDLPAGKITRIPHASYQGVYGETPERAAARKHFGLAEHESAVLFFGQMRPYKGVLTLLNATAEAAPKNPNLVLLLAGKTHDDDLAIIESELPQSVRAVRQHSFIPDEEASLWFAAADLAVFPYQRILNSGSVMLAATFGVPTVLPGEKHLREQYGEEEWVSFFSPDDATASLATILIELDGNSHEKRRAALLHAQQFTPFDMSNEFLKLLIDL